MSYVGIDLGTTFSVAATIDDTGRPVIVHNKDGENITPSCLLFEGEQITVGKEARKQYQSNPRVASRFKREMGTKNKTEIEGTAYTPTQLSALLLEKIKQDTEARIGEITEAVVTIPASFSNNARVATMAAAESAGLTVKYIINEPTAAALYYAYINNGEMTGNYAVYDLGGGTFDISIVHINGQDIEVLSSNGVTKLGGDDFDLVIQKLVQEKCKKETGETLEIEDYTKTEAEEDKKSLSKREKVLTRRIFKKNIEITRDEFNAGISSLISQTVMLCELSLQEAKLEKSDLQGVMLVGGSTRVPKIIESVKTTFGMEPIDTANVDEVVALGAALYAAYKSDKVNLNAIQKKSIEKIKIGEKTGKTYGTLAISNDNVQREYRDINSILIEKNKKIPCAVTKPFYTTHSNQTRLTCTVTESITPETDPKFVDVLWEGELNLPEGRPDHQEIKISFSYDDNQIMHCEFTDIETGRKTEVDIQMGSSDDDANNDNDPNKFLIE